MSRRGEAQTLRFAACFFGLSVGFFITVPLLALYLKVELKMAAEDVGVALALFTAASQGLQFFVGAVAGRWGNGMPLALGTVLAIYGYLSLAWPTLAVSITVSVLVLGAGNAAITVLGKAVIAATAQDRMAAFTLRSVAVNAGSALGPPIGGAMFGQFKAALSGVAVLYAVLGTFLVLAARQAPSVKTDSSLRPLADCLRNRPLVLLMAASVGFWFVYTQFTFTFSLFLYDSGKTGQQIGIIFGVNAVIVLTGQYFLVMRLARRIPKRGLLLCGLVVTPVAFAVLLGGATILTALVFVVLFSVGEILVTPLLDELASEAASDDAAVPTSLGFMSLGWLVGGTLGSLAGGAWFETLPHAQFWLAIVGCGLVPAALLTVKVNTDPVSV